MAFKRYANALIAKPGVQFDQWMDGIRAQHEGAVPKDYVGRIAKALLRKCDPGKYLLSHATIVASVDTYTPKGLKTGRKLQNGIQIDVKFPDIRIKPECHKIINNNGDAWSRPLLLSTYRTFIGAHNYLEHIQLPELSKGFIVDAVARDLGETVYVDILVATDRKHNLLIGDILGGKVNALSMGCFFPGTRITLEDGSVIPIEEIRPNMMVLSQKGNVCLVKNLQIRQNRWSMRRIKVSGLPIVESTYNHNFYVVPRKELTYIKKNGRNLLNHDDYRFEKLEAGSIQINDVVATPIPNTIVEPKISIKEARLLGLWVGDGWKWQNKHDSSTGIGIVCDSKYPEIIEDIISSINQISWKTGETRITSDGGSICKTEFFNAMNNYDGSFTNLCKESNISRRTGYNWVNGYKKLGRVVDKRNESKQVLRSQRRGADYLISSSRTVRNLIDSYVFGNKALNKLLSSDIVSWPIDHQLAFISGVIDSDGCVSTTKRGTKQVFISTRNENLACQYMSILLRCGIVSTLSVVKRNGTKLLPNSGGIDYQIRLRNDGVKKIPSLKIKSHLDSIKYTPGNSDRWISGGYLFSRVKKIDEFEYDGFVYDMEVDGDHSYIANGVGVSNCISLFTVCTKCGNVAADDSQLCFPENTFILKSDGTHRYINEIVEGDKIITHTGNSEIVTKTISRHYAGDLINFDIDGIPDPIRSTPEHPFFVLRPAQFCACGCGEKLHRTIEHERGSIKSFQRRYITGHNTRLVNPNQHSNIKSIQKAASIKDDLSFDFVEAKDVIPGDYLGFPIPQEVKNTDDATIDKARLIGYFLSEGCYIKRNNERVGITFTFGSHEHDTLSAETELLLNKVFSKSSRKKLLWTDIIFKNNIKPVVRNSNSRSIPEDAVCPDCGAPSEYLRNVRHRKGRDDCLKCKVCNRNWAYGSLDIVVARRKLAKINCSVVTFMDKSVAEFFYTYCGEYSNEKKLNSDVVLWDSDIQKHILFTWLNGDGHNSKFGIIGNTTSFNLLTQMHTIAARCGYYSRYSALFNGKSVEFRNVINGESVPIRDERGWLPIFALHIPENIGFSDNTRFIDKNIKSSKMDGFFDGFKKFGNYLVHRVRSKNVQPYHGDVYNLEVENDHSYVANGVAVHNCSCVQYEGKGSQFIDDSGVQHPIAELVGHVSVPNSNQFIEASWVRSPAFRGAVRRNLLNPDVEILASKLHDAVSIFELRKDFMKSDGIKKAASMIKKAQDPEDKPADEPPEDGPAEDKPEDADASMDSILEGGDTEDKPADDKSDDDKPADEPEIPVDKMKELLEKAQEMLLESIVKGLDKQLKPNSEDVGTIVPPSKPVPAGGVEDSLDNVVRSSQEFNRRLNKVFKNNSKLIKWASWAYKVVHEGGPKAIIATEMNPRDLIILSWIEDTVRSHNYSSDLYKIAIDIGSIDGYPSETSYLTACRVKLGRVLTPEEQQFFRWKGRIASLSKF